MCVCVWRVVRGGSCFRMDAAERAEKVVQYTLLLGSRLPLLRAFRCSLEDGSLAFDLPQRKTSDVKLCEVVCEWCFFFFSFKLDRSRSCCTTKSMHTILEKKKKNDAATVHTTRQSGGVEIIK